MDGVETSTVPISWGPRPACAASQRPSSGEVPLTLALGGASSHGGVAVVLIPRRPRSVVSSLSSTTGLFFGSRSCGSLGSPAEV